jgi:hypothetical protein
MLQAELDATGQAAWDRNARDDQAPGADRQPDRGRCACPRARHRRGRGRHLRPAARGHDRRGRGKGAAGEDAAKLAKELGGLRGGSTIRNSSKARRKRWSARGGRGDPREPERVRKARRCRGAGRGRRLKQTSADPTRGGLRGCGKAALQEHGAAWLRAFPPPCPLSAPRRRSAPAARPSAPDSARMKASSAPRLPPSKPWLRRRRSAGCMAIPRCTRSARWPRHRACA